MSSEERNKSRGLHLARRWFWASTLAFTVSFCASSLLADLVFGGLPALPGFAGFVLAAGLLAGAMTAGQASGLSERPAIR